MIICYMSHVKTYVLIFEFLGSQRMQRPSKWVTDLPLGYGELKQLMLYTLRILLFQQDELTLHNHSIRVPSPRHTLFPTCLIFIITLWLCRALHKYLIQIILQTKAPGKSQKVTHCFLIRDEWLGISGVAVGEGYWCWLNHPRMDPVWARGPRPAEPWRRAPSVWDLPAAALEQNAQLVLFFARQALWFLNLFFFFPSTAATEPLRSGVEKEREDVWLLSSVPFSLDKCI